MTADKANITAIVTAHTRVEQTLKTLNIIFRCDPSPAEVIVHVDQNQTDCANAIGQNFSEVRVLVSEEQLGPGGSRNKLLNAATYDLVASFDDDSYPLDSSYFSRSETLHKKFPNASIICAALYHQGEAVAPADQSAEWCADFTGGACLYDRHAFLSTGGYVPLPIAYGMEEVDLALRLHSQGGRILKTDWLRVFHDTNLERHADPEVTSRSIANLALLAYLRYPPSLWPLGVAQCVNRIVWLMCHKRFRGIGLGIRMIPRHLRVHQAYKMRINQKHIKSYLALRRAPLIQNI